MMRAFDGQPYLYFFVGKKAEQLQCIDFQVQVEAILGLHIHGQVTSFASLLEELMIYSRTNKVTLIIDEGSTEPVPATHRCYELLKSTYNKWYAGTVMFLSLFISLTFGLLFVICAMFLAIR